MHVSVVSHTRKFKAYNGIPHTTVRRSVQHAYKLVIKYKVIQERKGNKRYTVYIPILSHSSHENLWRLSADLYLKFHCFSLENIHMILLLKSPVAWKLAWKSQ